MLSYVAVYDHVLFMVVEAVPEEDKATAMPSTIKYTTCMPALSVAYPENVMVPDTVELAVGEVRTTGDWVVLLDTVTLTLEDCEALPAAS